jgi:hypothetical protein
MKFPRGNPVHQNLSTAYTNFDQLLGDLAHKQLSGCVELTSLGYRGLILMDSGAVTRAIEEFEGEGRMRLSTLDRVRAHSKDKDSLFSVYRFDSHLVGLLSGAALSAPLYEKLSTDLTSLDRLMSTLHKEKLAGYVEIELPDRSSWTVFLENGESVGAFYSENGHVLMDDSMLKKLGEASHGGATFTVYRSDPKVANKPIIAVSPELILAWEKILSLAQKAVDEQSSPGNFEIAFKQGCLDHVDDFRFLDPFVGRFLFKNERIQWSGSATDAQFNSSLAAALISATNHLEDREKFELNRAMSRAAATQRELFDICGLEPTVSQLFGSTQSRRIE